MHKLHFNLHINCHLHLYNSIERQKHTKGRWEKKESLQCSKLEMHVSLRCSNLNEYSWELNSFFCVLIIRKWFSIVTMLSQKLIQLPHSFYKCFKIQKQSAVLYHTHVLRYKFHILIHEKKWIWTQNKYDESLWQRVAYYFIQMWSW